MILVTAAALNTDQVALTFTEAAFLREQTMLDSTVDSNKKAALPTT
jgi:hypothetical protein